jgi:DNA polymerase V
MSTRFALVDCNNFYASCERVFDPALIGQPVVILSNNDGCVIARSEESKKLGIVMGAPAFRHREVFRRHGVRVLSSNFALYGDMSARVMNVIAPLVPAMEIYSIDEAFLRIGPDQGEDFARFLRKTVRQWTGIPVSIGIGPTKTLAKIANRIAKKQLQHNGFFEISAAAQEILSGLNCADIWGIGRRTAAKLALAGIRSARDLQQADIGWVRRKLGVVGERIVRELNGFSCLALEEIPPSKQSIATARSFGRRIESLDELEEALATYTARVAEKLRAAKLFATHLQVFVETNPFNSSQPQHHSAAQTGLPVPCNTTPRLIAPALELLRRIYRSGHFYKKTGVIVSGLVPESKAQPDLFVASENSSRQALAVVVDRINRKLGSGAVRYGSMGVAQNWSMRQERRSKKFTTRWSDLLVAKA